MANGKEQIDAFLAGGPPQRLARALKIARATDPKVGRSAAITALVTWIPLLILSLFQDAFYGGGSTMSFLNDFAVHARCLLAVPALIIAEVDAIPRLRDIPRQLMNGGFVRDLDRSRVERVLISTANLLRNRAAEVIVVIQAIAGSMMVGLFIPAEQLPAWHEHAGFYKGASLAKWWHSIVSAPALLILVVAWAWRTLLWWRFLWVVSQLKLRLVPAHPDHGGGIMFFVTSIRAFWFPAFALGLIVAGTVANRVVHGGEPLGNFNMLVAALIATVLVAFAGPLIFFAPLMREARRVGIFHYGQLANEVGREFEKKWLVRLGSIESDALEVPDFSATTDLYGVVSNVYSMRDIPVDLRVVVTLLIVTLLPFVPVVLLAIPLEELIRDIGNLLM